jgi:hypothetical protein
MIFLIISAFGRSQNILKVLKLFKHKVVQSNIFMAYDSSLVIDLVEICNSWYAKWHYLTAVCSSDPGSVYMC